MSYVLPPAALADVTATDKRGLAVVGAVAGIWLLVKLWPRVKERRRKRKLQRIISKLRSRR